MSAYERIILIDDNDADNFFHEIMIRRAGFNGALEIFESGPDALAFLEKEESLVPTCIFLDINMPSMDGFEVATRLTTLIEQHPWVVLVMLTSSGNPLDKERALSISSVKGFVTKPLEVEKVSALLQIPG